MAWLKICNLHYLGHIIETFLKLCRGNDIFWFGFFMGFEVFFGVFVVECKKITRGVGDKKCLLLFVAEPWNTKQFVFCYE